MSPTHVHPEHEETLFGVLAQQARSRSRAELWTTAVGGIVNATLVGLLYPHVSWLATAFLCVASYGVWGLADRAAFDLAAQGNVAPARISRRHGLRDLAGFIGALAGVWTMLAFMASALANWNH